MLIARYRKAWAYPAQSKAHQSLAHAEKSQAFPVGAGLCPAAMEEV
jgi:hypothetical protein